MAMTNSQDLCERLSHVEGMRRIGPLIAEARATIEAQAAHIAELDLQREQAVAEAEGYKEQHARDSAELRRVCAARDEVKERVKALEAKCALLAASLDQEEKRSEALEAGLTDGVTDDMAVLQSRVEELEAQLRERGEPVAWRFKTRSGNERWRYEEFEPTHISDYVFEKYPLYYHPPAAAASDVMTYPEELTPDLREVLGWTCFQCGPIAHAMRAAVMDINPKAEDEQAHALHWMVKLVLKHGAEWRAAGAEDIRGWKATIAAQKERGE